MLYLYLPIYIVIRLATYPNVLLNDISINNSNSSQSSVGNYLSRTSYIAGDWKDLNILAQQPHTPPLVPSLILASETVYRVEGFRTQKRILQLFIGKHGLNPSGSALFAGRTTYFGVGGGINAFKAYLETIQDPIQDTDSERTSEESTQNPPTVHDYLAQDESFVVQTVWTSSSLDSAIILVKSKQS